MSNAAAWIKCTSCESALRPLGQTAATLFLSLFKEIICECLLKQKLLLWQQLLGRQKEGRSAVRLTAAGSTPAANDDRPLAGPETLSVSSIWPDSPHSDLHGTRMRCRRLDLEQSRSFGPDVKGVDGLGAHWVGHHPCCRRSNLLPSSQKWFTNTLKSQN